MNASKWSLLFLGLCYASEASAWTIEVPSSVKGLLGSCVVIPCSFNYPDPGKQVTVFTGIWTDATSHLIYHPIESKILQQYRNRTRLLGDLRQKDCSLMIDPLRASDRGPFHFRIEIEDYDKFSYKENTVSITVTSELNPILFSVKEDIVEGQTASATCSVSHSCPASPPVITWSHSGQAHSQRQSLDNGQWKATSTLTFHPTHADHNKPLQCTVRYKGGQQQKLQRALKVKYAPVNVKVEQKSVVKEGESALLNCSSDARPPASSYEWHNDSGVQVHKGNLYMLRNASKHSAALYCTAINTLGRNKSSPVKLNVIYAPEIKSASSCSSEGDTVKCVCIVESQPLSMVHFLVSDEVLPHIKIEHHGSVTIATLEADLGPSEVIQCRANNTLGKDHLTLHLPVERKNVNIYIAVAVGAAVLILVIVLVVRVAKKRFHTPDSPTCHIQSKEINKEVELPQYAATTRKKDYDDVCGPGIYTNDHLYGNMEAAWDPEDDAIYANV